MYMYSFIYNVTGKDIAGAGKTLAEVCAFLGINEADVSSVYRSCA